MNLEKAGYRTLVLYIFFPFLSFFIFSRLPFPLFVNLFFLFFLFPFSPTPTPNSSPHLPHPHSQPVAPDHSLPEARSHRRADSHPRSRPRPTPPPLVHPRRREPGPTTPRWQENAAHYPQLAEDAPLVHAECHKSPPQSPARHRQKHEFQVEAETSGKPEMSKQPQAKRELKTRKLLPRTCCQCPQNQH